MSKIYVSRTYIKITNYNFGDAPGIENDYSIWNPNYHRREYKGIFYNRSTKELFLPRGTSIDRLERIFGVEAIISSYIDNPRQVGNLGLKKQPRDDDQKQALRFMLGIDEYYYTADKTMLSLNLNTGKGKSYCAVSSIAYYGFASIIITDTLNVLDQWRDYFYEYTDIKTNEIYYLTGSPSIQKLFKRDIAQYKVFLATHATLSSYTANNGFGSLGELFKYLGIGLKFYDESHLDFDSMCLIDFQTHSFKTFYLTATPARSAFDQNIIYKAYFNGVPSIELFHIDEDPHTMYAGLLYNSHPTPMDIQGCKSNYGLNRMAYADYVVRQPAFHNLLRILIDKAMSKPGKSLWYIGTNSAIMYVRDWIYTNYPELVGSVGVYTSIVPPEKKREQLNRKIILSTTKSTGAAMDIKDLVETIPLAEPFKSRVLAQQTLGRTRADNTIYKEIVDIGFPQIRKYYKFKQPIFMKYATECREVILRDDELNKRANAIIDDRKDAIFPMKFYDNTFENLDKNK